MFTSLADTSLVNCLKQGGLVVMPTDTIYGLVASAENQQAVERLYAVRGRAPQKPCIVLVASVDQITDVESWSPKHKQLAKMYWPGPMSLVVQTSKAPEYLHRSTKTLAYRVPSNKELRQLLLKTGPLIAPSANPEGQPPATTIKEAQKYFGEKIDGYVQAGKMAGGAPSTVVEVNGEKIVVLRQGAIVVED